MISRGRVPTAWLWLTIVTYSICSASPGSWHIMVPLEVCSTYVPKGLFGTRKSHLMLHTQNAAFDNSCIHSAPTRMSKPGVVLLNLCMLCLGHDTTWWASPINATGHGAACQVFDGTPNTGMRCSLLATALHDIIRHLGQSGTVLLRWKLFLGICGHLELQSWHLCQKLQFSSLTR